MRGRTALGWAALLAMGAAGSLALLFGRRGPGPEVGPGPPPPTTEPPPSLAEDLGEAGTVDPGPRPWEEEAGLAEAPAPEGRGGPLPPEPEALERQAAVLRDPSWKAYPDGEIGPVVVGVLARAGETDPAGWVALEDLDHPEREDPSRVESLDWGRFRLTGVPPGRYRVRARTDDGFAVYSAPLAVADGEVADAGVLRLQRPGSLAGEVRAPDGGFAEAVVRLFGRNPASLEPAVVETRHSRGREGFQMAPHEAGPFLLGVVAREGYAVHRGSTDAAGLGWCAVRLEPWQSLEVALAPAAPDAPEGRILRATLEPREVPDLGLPTRVRSLTGPGRFSHLAAGRYRLEVRWAEARDGGWVDRLWKGELLVPTPDRRVEVPR